MGEENIVLFEIGINKDGVSLTSKSRKFLKVLKFLIAKGFRIDKLAIFHVVDKGIKDPRYTREEVCQVLKANGLNVERLEEDVLGDIRIYGTDHCAGTSKAVDSFKGYGNEPSIKHLESSVMAGWL